MPIMAGSMPATISASPTIMIRRGWAGARSASGTTTRSQRSRASRRIRTSDMEIITYVRTGAITHQDSMGNKGRTEAGDVQVMSAGTGVRHAEYNLEPEKRRSSRSGSCPARMAAISPAGAPSLSQGRPLGPVRDAGESGFAGDDEALPIRANARVLGRTLKAGESVDHDVGDGRHAYLVPPSGAIEIDGQRFEARDGARFERRPDRHDHRARRRRDRAGRLRITDSPGAPRLLPVAGRGHPLQRTTIMSKILVLYYSSYGHLAKMADAVAEGARSGRRRSRRPPRPRDRARRSRRRPLASSPITAIRCSRTSTIWPIMTASSSAHRRASAACRARWRASGIARAASGIQGALNGKVGGAFTSTASQHGGQETTLFSIITNLLHFGLTIVGLDYGSSGPDGRRRRDGKGGSPYGATTIADSDGSRQPSEVELDGARYQGRRSPSWPTRSRHRGGVGSSACAAQGVSRSRARAERRIRTLTTLPGWHRPSNAARAERIISPCWRRRPRGGMGEACSRTAYSSSTAKRS
jgi:NAD(P)H dehydrogenase (quinone)